MTAGNEGVGRQDVSPASQGMAFTAGSAVAVLVCVCRAREVDPMVGIRSTRFW